MREQYDMEELSQHIDNEREEQISKLKAQLTEAEAAAANNKGAADILTDMLQKGEVVQEPDGRISVSKAGNIIRNQHEVDN